MQLEVRSATQKDLVTPVDAANPLPVSNAPVGATAGSGFASAATFTPAAAAYLANDVMEGAKEFAGIGPSGGGLVLVTATRLQVAVNGLQASEAAYVLKFYSQTPPSAYADNAAWNLPSGDRAPIYLGELALGTPVDLGDTLLVEQTGALKMLNVPEGGSVWAYLLTAAGFTATAAARRVEIETVPA